MTDTTTLTVWTIRAMPVETRDKLTRGARMRGITIGEYLTRLVELHVLAREMADAGIHGMQANLNELGLEAVRE